MQHSVWRSVSKNETEEHPEIRAGKRCKFQNSTGLQGVYMRDHAEGKFEDLEE